MVGVAQYMVGPALERLLAPIGSTEEGEETQSRWLVLKNNKKYKSIS